MNKKIYYYNTSIHTYMQMEMQNPPEGYEFIAIGDKKRKGQIDRLRNNAIIRLFYKDFIKKVFNVAPILHRAYYKNAPIGTDLILSTGALINERRPWIMETLDAPHSIGGNDYKTFVKSIPMIERSLSSNFCKRIIVHTEECRRLYERYFSEKVTGKIVKITPAIPSGNKAKKKILDKNNCTFLFMGSVNNPDEFYIKGGLETLETFKRLREKYKNTRLIVKCKVPAELKQKYNMPGIEYIEGIIPKEKVDELYQKSDALLMPGHGYYIMAFLEAFSYGLPVISIDSYCVDEFVFEGKNGFVIKKSDKLPYNSEEYPVNVRDKEFIDGMKKIDNRVLNDLFKKCEILIKNPEIRDSMSKKTLEIFKERHSMNKKNKALQKVFDAAIAG